MPVFDSSPQLRSQSGGEGKVADLGAGSGELSQFLPAGAVCVEVHPARAAAGQRSDDD